MWQVIDRFGDELGTVRALRRRDACRFASYRFDVPFRVRRVW